MVRMRLVLGWCLLFALAVVGTVWAGVVTERISLTSFGGSANGASWGASISDDAQYVAFYSGAGNLVVGDTNGFHDVFVRDRLFGTIQLISRSSTGVLGNDHSLYPDLSEDGRYVAFCSMASNLVSGDTNGFMDVFVRDLEADTTRRVSVTNVGGQANEKSVWCAISEDGRYVVFQSEATNVISGEVFGWPGIYLADLNSPTASVQAVSVTETGESPNETSVKPNISADGRYVVYRSWADDLVVGDTNGFSDVFLRDMVGETTERISVADLTGVQGDGETAGQPAITPDGRYVVFASYASNLVANDTNGKCDVFLRDRQLDRTERISVSSAESQGNDESGGESLMMAVSPDGRYVTFASLASNLVVGDTNVAWDVFVRDRQAGTTTRVSVTTTGVEGNHNSGIYSVAMTSNGETIAFDSSADNLVLLDTNVGPDVFAHGESLAPAAPILIVNGDDDYTTSPEVTLYIDPGDYSELRFKNETGDWTAWEPAVGTKEWTLTSGDGLKRIYIQGRDGVELSVENYDEITLDTVAPASASIKINSNDATTISRTVTLTLTASGATQMRFRNETSAWSEWVSLSASKVWKLSHDRGMKTVGFQCRDEAGNATIEVTDTIDLITFTDVPVDFWAFEEIMACVDADLVTGYLEGDYKPLDIVTRGQMAVYTARGLAGGESNVPAGPIESSFWDVTTDYWAYDHIEYAVAQGVVRGFPEGDYKPEQQLNRGEMAVYIARSIASPIGEDGLADYQPPDQATFPDVPNTGYGDDGTEPFWAYKHVEYCYENNVVRGYDDGYYQPDWYVTRDQMAVYIARAFELPTE